MRKFITTEERNKSSFPGHYSFDLDNKCGRYCTKKKPGHPRYDGQYDRLRLVNVQTAFEKPKTFSSFTISHIILKRSKKQTFTYTIYSTWNWKCSILLARCALYTTLEIGFGKIQRFVVESAMGKTMEKMCKSNDFLKR